MGDKTKKASLIIPQDTDAVKIMTIHASKGLEFPVVIIPYCNWKTEKAQEAWIRIHSDEINLPVAVVTLSEKASESGYSSEVNQEKQAMVLDHLNLIYVAFTRAIERLHIISQNTKNSTSNVNGWILNALSESLNTETQTLIEFGTKQGKKLQAKKDKRENYALQELDFTKNKVEFALKPSYLFGSDEETAREQGIILHWLLAQISDKEDLNSAFEQGILKGYFSHSDIPKLSTKIKAILSHPELEHYFEIGVIVKNEAELLTNYSNILRPDKIIFNKNELVLIDFKSGKEFPEKHAAQLEEYANALISMGYSKVKKLLVYLEENRVVELN